ncbi:MAG: type II toxin-antitoxin system YoeB family toxin [Dysgonamonadaceae bacterium]|jgi:toxin YoeB|nr:type II toxin-antitoxin system YoeB family toxin [Dysgonamonadaceae bacterium]
MKYTIRLNDAAEKDFAKLKKSEPKRYQQALSLLVELELHPTTGTGKPEQLKHYAIPTWSRRISDKHAWFTKSMTSPSSLSPRTVIIDC